MSRRWLFLAAMWLVLADAPSVSADPPNKAPKAEREPRKKQRRARKERRRPAQQPQERRDVAEAKPADVKPENAPAPSAAQKAAQEAAQGANAEIVKEGDTSVKMMTFSGLDIEGRLKSPQLLYFVSRVQAEFDRPKLPHRSFMPELSRSTEQDPLR